MSDFNLRRVCPPDVVFFDVHSRNETESDRPGHGRLLGNLYSRCGRLVEASLNSLAKKTNIGPSAVVRRVKNRVLRGERRARELDIWDGRVMYRGKEANDQRKDLKKLVHYARSVTHHQHVFYL